MRQILLTLVLLATTTACFSQSIEEDLKKLRKKRVNNYVITGSLTLLSGAADGFNQALMHRYAGVKRVFPNINDNYWWPVKSAYNKYKNGDPAQGARFPGSKTWLVFTTDGYHLTRFADHLFMAGALAFKLAGYEKKKWYIFVLEAAGYWFINRVGFCLTYNQFSNSP